MAGNFPPVVGYRDAVDALDEQNMNRPITALVQRTDYLKALLDTIAGTPPFEAVRLSGVALSTTDVPTVYDFVYLEEVTGHFAPAEAKAIPSAIEAYASAGLTAYAVGLLVDATSGFGTVVTYGRVDLSSVLLTTLLETNEVFRDGPYFLSTAEPGKMTANPRGPAIYLGYFLADVDNPGYGSFAVLAPQLKDIWQAHLHYNFALAGQPAGDNEPTGITPTDMHYVRGIKPDDYQPGGGHAGAPPPIRALITGDWTGTGSVTYTFWVTTTDDTLSGALVRWSTSDGSDDVGGAAGVRLMAFNQPIAVGAKGLYFTLEKGGAFTTYTATADFDELVTGGVAQVERQWTISVPSRVQGWLQKWVRSPSSYTGSTPTTETKVVMYLFGRYVNPDKRAFEEINVAVTNAGGHFSAGTVNLSVTDRYGTVIDTFANVGYSGVALAIKDGVSDYDLWLVISKYDAVGDPVIDSGGGLQTSDSWQATFQDEAPGAAFEYAVDFDPNLDAYYPPRPLAAVVMEINGVTLDPRDAFGVDLGAYLAGPRTLFWYPDDYARVPFPRDWETEANPGSFEFQTNTMLYFNRLAMAAAGIVTSLIPDSESPIAIVDALSGEPASIGDLKIRADMTVLLEDVLRTGYLAAKGVGSNGKLQTGPVVEKLESGPGIEVSTIDGAPAGQGTVRISYSGEGLGVGNFEDITLQNAKQEVVPNKLFSFIKLLAWDSAGSDNIDSGFLAQLRVPPSLTGSYRALLYFSIFGLEKIDTGVNVNNTLWAGLTMTYSIIRDYSLAGGTPAYVDDTLLDANEVTYQMPNDVPFGRAAGSSVPGVAYRAYDPILLHNDADLPSVEGEVTDPFMPTGIPTPGDVTALTFALLTAGDLVAVKIVRSSPTLTHQGANKEYTAPIGIIKLRWKLVGV